MQCQYYYGFKYACMQGGPDVEICPFVILKFQKKQWKVTLCLENE